MDDFNGNDNGNDFDTFDQEMWANYYAYNETHNGDKFSKNKKSGSSGGGCLTVLAVLGVIYLIVSLFGGH